MTEPGASPSQRAALVRVLLLLAASVAAVGWPKLSPATAFLVLAVGLSVPVVAGPRKAWIWSALGLAALATCVGFGRFLMGEAIPGVVAGGNAAVSKHAVAFLRTVVSAEDKLRQNGELDHDGDGIGSAAFIAELAGLRSPLRSTRIRQIPLHLKPEQVLASADGEVVAQGAFLVKVCLPRPDGSFTAITSDAVDQEAAERRYTILAWPRGLTPGAPSESYFLDQHERILVQRIEPSRYVGTTLGPPCGLVPENSDGWHPWQEKAPRRMLPGDTSAPPGKQ